MVFWFWSEAGAATAGAGGVRVFEGKASAKKVSGVHESCTAQEFGGLLVADDFEPVLFEDEVDGFGLVVEAEHVFEAGASAAFDADAQEGSGVAFPGKEVGDLLPGFGTDLDGEGGRFGVHSLSFTTREGAGVRGLGTGGEEVRGRGRGGGRRG